MISVCIATYNGGKYIREQIDSILPQLGTDDEIIISDDGSTDDTLPIIQAYNDKRIHIIEGPKKHNLILNFECALNEAKGNYIFLADQDDVWLPGKIETCMKYLQRYCCVVSDCYVTDAELNIIENSFQQMSHAKTGKWHNLLIKNAYLGCCMAFRRELLDKALPFPMATPMHDIWLGNVAAFKYNMVFIAEKLVYFRRHHGNASSTASPSKYPLTRKLAFRMAIIKGLLKL